MFILGMDLLTRHLQFQVNEGVLKGVKIAASAHPIVSCVYADDLLLFGAATEAEALLIKQALSQFSKVSGQIIGPQKSSIWFSALTGPDQIQSVSDTLEVPTDRQPGRHLGAPVNPGQASYDFILEKFSNKLTAWKARLLTPAGRVVLIKSVLQSLPVYYMATERIPKKVLSALTSMIRRFFWGANDKDRFMAYVAWDKITQPLQNGGLAIRDLNVVNEALLMKALWKLASNSEAQWVMLVKAKYLPRSHLWNSKRTYNCSIF